MLTISRVYDLVSLDGLVGVLHHLLPEVEAACLGEAAGDLLDGGQGDVVGGAGGELRGGED